MNEPAFGYLSKIIDLDVLAELRETIIARAWVASTCGNRLVTLAVQRSQVFAVEFDCGFDRGDIVLGEFFGEAVGAVVLTSVIAQAPDDDFERLRFHCFALRFVSRPMNTLYHGFKNDAPLQEPCQGWDRKANGPRRKELLLSIRGPRIALDRSQRNVVRLTYIAGTSEVLRCDLDAPLAVGISSDTKAVQYASRCGVRVSTVDVLNRLTSVVLGPKRGIIAPFPALRGMVEKFHLENVVGLETFVCHCLNLSR
jgi:hypothetical protein